MNKMKKKIKRLETCVCELKKDLALFSTRSETTASRTAFYELELEGVKNLLLEAKGKFKKGRASSLSDEDQQVKDMWIANLKKDKLSEIEIVQGFLLYYVLEGLSFSDIEEDLVSLTGIGGFYVGAAIERIKSVLLDVVDGEALECEKEDMDEAEK